MSDQGRNPEGDMLYLELEPLSAADKQAEAEYHVKRVVALGVPFETAAMMYGLRVEQPLDAGGVPSLAPPETSGEAITATPAAADQGRPAGSAGEAGNGRAGER